MNTSGGELLSGIGFSNLSSKNVSNQENIIDGKMNNNDGDMLENGDDKSNPNDGYCAFNNKEKSPMCLVNELCRFNSITCRYELIEESGAPHSRTFSVLLRLGDKEEYRSSALSIRKAQHAAASLALQSTKFPQPSPKSQRKVAKCNSQLTPTVELNVLAMKRREQVQYHVYEQPIRPNLLSNLMSFPSSVSNQMTSNPGDFHNYRNLYNQRFPLIRGVCTPWYVATVMVGERQFSGKGKTIQIARHAAAEEALKTIRQLPLPTTTPTTNTNTPTPVGLSLVEVEDDDDDSKSPVSMIYEAAMKRKYLVQFDVISESGPSHMPCFVIKCTVGNYSAMGRGVRKKTAKRRAAAAVLAELEEKEPLNVTCGQSKTTPVVNDPNNLNSSSPTKEKSSTDRLSKKRTTGNKTNKKKRDQSAKLDEKVDDLATRLHNTKISSPMDSVNCPVSEMITCQSNSITKSNQQSKELAEGDDDVKLIKTSFTLNPISRLLQLQMAKKEDEPKFKLISEVDIEHRKKEFTIQCSIKAPKNSRFIAPTISNELITFGFGPNKRIAKRNAADEMLNILGYSSSSSSSSSSTTSSSSSASSSSSSLSPILKMTTNSTTAQNVNQQDDPEMNQVKSDLNKERRVKFMMDTTNNSKDNIQDLDERLENLSELTQQQLISQSDSPNKYGRQIAPGLLFVMSMNQTNSNYPIRLMDNQNAVDKL